MKSKKSQFFIIAAVLLVVVITSLMTTINYVETNPPPDRFYDVAENYFKECSNAIDYGFATQEITGKSPEDQIDEFSLEFLGYLADVDPYAEVIYVYGNKEEVTVMNYADYENEVEICSTKDKIKGGKQTSSGNIELGVGKSKFRKKVKENLKNLNKLSEHRNYGQFVKKYKKLDVCGGNKISKVKVKMQKHEIKKSEKNQEGNSYKEQDIYEFGEIGKDPKFFVIIRTQRYGETYVFTSTKDLK